MQCVMFDLGNVLAHYRSQRWLDFLERYRQPGAEAPSKVARADHVVKYDLGQIGDFEFFDESKRIWKIDVSEEVFFAEFVELLVPDLRMIALNQMLIQNGVKTALVSNINRVHFEVVNRRWPEVFMGLDYLALSFRLGLRKPDPKIWQVASRKIKAPISECFFIDDLRENIAAFEQLGGVGHHYDVVDERFCPNGRLETERNRLLLRMANLGLITFSQASSIARVDLSQSE